MIGNNSSAPFCTPSGQDMELAEFCTFWLEGVALTCVGSFGIVGNLLIILVLSTNEMRNSFNLLLIVLSSFDILFIFFAILDYGMARVFRWPFDFNSEVYALIFPKFLYPLNNIIFNCSIFLTIVIAYERFSAVCRPHAYRANAAATGIGRKVAGYVLPVVVFSTALNIPKFWETELVTASIPDESGTTFVNVTSYILTELRNDPLYITYYINWTRLLLTGILPVTLLGYFNTKIFRGIKYAHVRSNRNSSTSNEMNLAGILVCIVIVFLICHFPRLLINCAEFLMTNSILMCSNFIPPAWFLCLTSFMHWLLILNASTNFIIYCFMGNKFKAVLREKLRSFLPEPQMSELTTMDECVEKEEKEEIVPKHPQAP